MNQILAASMWMISVAVNGFLLFHLEPRVGPVVLAKRAGLSALAAPVFFVAVVLILWLAGAHPSSAVGSALFAAMMATVVIAMINIANVIFHGMVDGVIAFHEQYNAANIHRFPVRILIAHRAGLKRAATTVWWLGSALMLYGLWFHTEI